MSRLLMNCAGARCPPYSGTALSLMQNLAMTDQVSRFASRVAVQACFERLSKLTIGTTLHESNRSKSNRVCRRPPGHGGQQHCAQAASAGRRTSCSPLIGLRWTYSQADVHAFFAANAIDQVYLAAAKVGGIHANNTFPAEFIYQNLMVQANIIQAAHSVGVQKLLFLGSSCIYPKNAAQPMAEDALLTGTLRLPTSPMPLPR